MKAKTEIADMKATTQRQGIQVVPVTETGTQALGGKNVPAVRMVYGS